MKLHKLLFLAIAFFSSLSLSFAEDKHHTVRVLVAHTPAAGQAILNDGNPSISSFLLAGIAHANLINSDSNVDFIYDLAYAVQLTYTETSTNRDDLANINNPNHPARQTLDWLRNAYNADLVVLVTDDHLGSSSEEKKVAGIAGVDVSEDLAFAVVEWLGYSGTTLSHEMAHLFGAQHNVANANTPPTYSFGYGACSPHFKTIMSYDPPECTRGDPNIFIYHGLSDDVFSGPYAPARLFYKIKTPTPSGWSESEIQIIPQVHGENNQLLMNMNRHEVANFRTSHDTFDTAMPLRSAITSDAISPAGNVDYFVFHSGGGNVTIQSTGGTDSYGSIYNYNGDLIAEDDDLGEGLNFSISRYFPRGLYYLTVRHWSALGSGAYNIQLINGTPSSVWNIYGVVAYNPISIFSGKCLDVIGNNSAPGTDLQIWDCTNSPGQRWVQRADGTIRSYDGTRCLDLESGNHENRIRAQIEVCNANNPNQRWVFRADGTLRVYADTVYEKCLSVYGGGNFNGNIVETYNCNGTPAERWGMGPGINGVMGLSSGRAESGYVQIGNWSYYSIQANQAQTYLKVLIDTLSSDVDLYVRKGSQPSLGAYDCRPYSGGTSSESCFIGGGAETVWHIGVHGYSAGAYHIIANLKP